MHQRLRELDRVYHGNFKPSNVVIHHANGVLKLCDCKNEAQKVLENEILGDGNCTFSQPGLELFGSDIK